MLKQLLYKKVYGGKLNLFEIVALWFWLRFGKGKSYQAQMHKNSPMITPQTLANLIENGHQYQIDGPVEDYNKIDKAYPDFGEQ